MTENETTENIRQGMIRKLLADNAALLFALRTLASDDVEMKDARRVAADIIRKIEEREDDSAKGDSIQDGRSQRAG